MASMSDAIDLIDPVLSHHSPAWIMRACANIMLGQYDAAEADLKVAQAIYPEREELSGLLTHFDEIKRLHAEGKLPTAVPSGELGPQDAIRFLVRKFLQI